MKGNEKASNLLEQAQLLLEKYRCNESYVLARYFQAAAEITAITGQSEVAITYYQEALAQIDFSDENEIDSRTLRELRTEIYFELGQILRQLGRFEEV